ncbi:MAG: hypothetical protein ACKVX9_04125 [Blastocatellia bacterium]
MQQPIWNFEREPSTEPMDETGVNLRAYFDRMDDEKMREYASDWSDASVVEWDGNFRDDDGLMLPCCERDVDIHEYRQVLEACIEYRNRIRPQLTQSAGQ